MITRQERAERARARKARINNRITELKKAGLSDHQIVLALMKKEEFDMDRQRAERLVYPRIEIATDHPESRKPAPKFLRDWEAEG